MKLYGGRISTFAPTFSPKMPANRFPFDKCDLWWKETVSEFGALFIRRLNGSALVSGRESLSWVFIVVNSEKITLYMMVCSCVLYSSSVFTSIKLLLISFKVNMCRIRAEIGLRTNVCLCFVHDSVEFPLISSTRLKNEYLYVCARWRRPTLNIWPNGSRFNVPSVPMSLRVLYSLHYTIVMIFSMLF